MQINSVFHILNETNILLFLVQFFLLLFSAKVLGMLFTRLKQPTVTADIIVGVILGPTILGRFAPSVHNVIFPADPIQITMLDTVSWLGIFFLLLVTGLEVNFSSVWKQKGKATWVALSDLIIPITISISVLIFLPDRYMIDPDSKLLFVLFLSSIMTISAMPVSISVMKDFKLLRTDLGFLTVSALSINDLVGWVVFTIILGIFAHGSPDIPFVLSLVFFTLIFLVISTTIIKDAISYMITTVKKRTIDPSGYILTIISLTGMAFGAITQKIGIHALFGFFLAGLIVGESRDLSEKARSTIESIVYAVFIPIFFANIGLKVDIFKNFDIPLIIIITVLGIFSRFIGAYIGVILARIPRAQRWPVSILHTPGGEMHIVIGALALELSLINETVFVAIIVAAVISSVILGPWLALVIERIAPRETVKVPADAAFEISSVEKFDALREFSQKAAGILHLDPQEIFDIARNREEGMSTGLEKGLAFPHARIPNAPQSLVVFGRSREGIDWNTPDGLPARLIFFIITAPNEMDIQLRIYGQILRVLSIDEDREVLVKAPSIKSAVDILNDRLKVTAIDIGT